MLARLLAGLAAAALPFSRLFPLSKGTIFVTRENLIKNCDNFLSSPCLVFIYSLSIIYPFLNFLLF